MIRPVPFVLLGLVLAAAGCDRSAQANNLSDSGAELDVPVDIENVTVGEGPPAEEADLIIVEYVGTYPDSGLVFDQNNSEDEDGNRVKPPLSFLLGRGAVIEGWDEAIVGMRKGGERNLKVPWQKAYGTEGNGTIPGETDLLFNVKVLDIVRPEDHDVYDVDDVLVGTGREAKDGDTVTIHYRGTYSNGMRFDSSYERGEEDGGTPLTFTIGLGHVIIGIDAGVQGMRVGGRRRLRLPPTLVYGTVGNRVIQGNQVCYFDIELFRVK
ncbi:MAG: FKBP-type peptidyl-prolyl cis-trans isomerase [Armatimonadetes bacterium]|nr:FKBP-type peptidyl-prolyl cis-trans isomerase [Armatimonadota bacterium]